MAQPAAVLFKFCSKCGIAKPLDDFRIRKGACDGRHGWCNPCYNAYYSEASRRWRAANADRNRANQRQQYWRDPEKARERKRRHDEQNRDEINARAREYQRRTYTGEVRAARLERMHRRRLATQTSPVLAAYIAELLRQPCAYCGGTENIEIDHIVPISRNGEHVADNLAPACRFCNRSKKDKLLSEWSAA